MIKIDINLVFTIINLIVLYLLMKKFLFGPIIGVMEKRKAMIDEQFASAEKTTTEANQLKGQYEDALKSAKEESFSIVEQAKDEAKVQADSIVKRANDQAGQILEKARRDISTEQEAAMKAMEGKVAELAMDAASRIMGKKNDEAQDMSLYDQFLEGAGDLSVPGEAICETGRIFKNTPEIGKMLENPLVSLKEKEQVIERVFPQEMKSFLKVTCKYQKIDRIGEILEAYDAYSREQKGILKAELLYVTRPAEEQENKMKEFLRSQFSAREVELTLTEDKSLVGGFVLRAGDREYDWSLIGRYKKLKQKLTRR